MNAHQKSIFDVLVMWDKVDPRYATWAAKNYAAMDEWQLAEMPSLLTAYRKQQKEVTA
jgi:hypothetical protein